MAANNPKGRTPTKRIDMYKDHEFVVGKLVLGRDESAETYQVILGAGTYSAPIECTTDEDMHWIDLNFKGLAPAGSNRGIYMRLRQGTTGTTGPTGIKVATILDNAVAVGNACGIHGELKFGTAGSKVIGEGQGLAGQLNIPNRAVDVGGWGTTSGVKASIQLDGTSSDLTPATAAYYGVLRLVIAGGNQAARRKVQTLIHITAEEGAKASKYAASNADVTGSGGASAKGIQVNLNGTQYWIPLYTI